MAAREGLLRRLLGTRATEAPQALTPQERAGLEHERRRLQRMLREAQRRVEQHHCSTCLKAEDPVGVALDRRARALAAELERIEARLRSAG